MRAPSNRINITACNLDDLLRSSCSREEIEQELTIQISKVGKDAFMRALSAQLVVWRYLLAKNVTHGND
ncbi:Uncharacterised protein [Escherichia coli]|nr:Uncharacterised protein [Escherichia coli]CAD6181994.1 Uncharacterised protein [Escherichia coli]